MPDETKPAATDTQDAATETTTTTPELEPEQSVDERLLAAGWRKVRGAWRR